MIFFELFFVRVNDSTTYIVNDFLWSTQGEKYTYIHLNLLISADESPAVLFNYNWSFLFTKIIKKKEHR